MKCKYCKLDIPTTEDFTIDDHYYIWHEAEHDYYVRKGASQ